MSFQVAYVNKFCSNEGWFGNLGNVSKKISCSYYDVIMRHNSYPLRQVFLAYKRAANNVFELYGWFSVRLF